MSPIKIIGKSRARCDKGFTLIEILVVISIIGLLASIVLVALSGARSKARDAVREIGIKQIQVELEAYYDAHGQYPRSGGAGSPNAGWSNSNDDSWNTLESRLGKKLPKDPLNQSPGWPGGGVYSYGYFSLGYDCSQQWYMLVYRLEEKPMNSPGASACSRRFNYSNTITTGMCKAGEQCF